MERKMAKMTSLIIIILTLVVSLLIYQMSIRERIKGTKFNLKYTRLVIQGYETANNRKPRSLSVLLPFMKEEDGHASDAPFFLCELLTNVNKECSVLDGTGGWYYNSETGELRVNLLKPVKSYFLVYLGKDADQIPASW